jgi:hypothetical protein
MVFIALDGVAATTKTTVINKLRDTYHVHLNDYKDVGDKLRLCPDDKMLNGLVYLLSRSLDYEHLGSRRRHLFDREPCAALLYHLIHNDRPDKEVEALARMVKFYNLNSHWRSLILLTLPGQEQLVVNVMIKRANGLDDYTVDYVKRQNRIFKIWVRIMNYPTYVVDHSKDLARQQEEIQNILHDMFEEHCPLPWYKRCKKHIGAYIDAVVPRRNPKHAPRNQ